MENISVVCRRKKDGEMCPDVSSIRTEVSALKTFLECELGFGGKIIEMSNERIVTRTEVLGCVDETIFEGKLERFVQACELFEFLRQTRMESISRNIAFDILAKEQNGEKGITGFELENIMPIMSFMPISAIVALILFDDGTIEKGIESIGKMIKKARSEDIFAAIDLHVQNNISLEEALKLAA